MKYEVTLKSIKRAKDISKHIVKNMKHELYRGLRGTENHTYTDDNHSIKTTQHSFQTTTFKERALSAWEDKRSWFSENESLPHRHVDSPMPIAKRRRVMMPLSGDVVDVAAVSTSAI